MAMVSMNILFTFGMSEQWASKSIAVAGGVPLLQAAVVMISPENPPSLPSRSRMASRYESMCRRSGAPARVRRRAHVVLQEVQQAAPGPQRPVHGARGGHHRVAGRDHAGQPLVGEQRVADAGQEVVVHPGKRGGDAAAAGGAADGQLQRGHRRGRGGLHVLGQHLVEGDGAAAAGQVQRRALVRVELHVPLGHQLAEDDHLGLHRRQPLEVLGQREVRARAARAPSRGGRRWRDRRTPPSPAGRWTGRWRCATCPADISAPAPMPRRIERRETGRRRAGSVSSVLGLHVSSSSRRSWER